MGGEPEVKPAPGDGAAVPAGGEPAKPATPAGASFPPELKPEIDAYVNRAVESALRTGRSKWESEAAEQKRLAELPEVERLRAENQRLSLETQEMAGEREFRNLTDQVGSRLQSKGLRIPPSMIRSALEQAVDSAPDDASIDIDGVTAAVEAEWRAYAPGSGRVQVQRTPGGGGTPSAGPEWHGWNMEQITEHADTLGPVKGGQFLREIRAHMRTGWRPAS